MAGREQSACKGCPAAHVVSAHPGDSRTTTQAVTRKMGPQDIPAGLRLCRASGWNQVEDDWHLFLTLRPYGCRVAEENGEVVGTVATLRYEERFSWVAMMLVDPERRRAGIGRKLLSEALDLLNNERCVRLDATPTGREMYRLYGFEDEYPLLRFARPAERRQASSVKGIVRQMMKADLAEVFAFDCQAFGADRSAILTSLFRRSPNYAWVSESTASHSGTQGYCLGRPGFRYHQIGPVVASDERIAGELVAQCIHANAGVCFGIDAPQHSRSWREWLIEQGFVEERPFVRMCRGELRDPGEFGSVFAIVGPEFG
jgi:GNAT superfamily N-acetyltransferase